jgi:malate dehydrogenase (oxaloacetate-decarboxylating)(NADP+)
MVHKGDADAMLCGTIGRYYWHLKYITDVVGLADGAEAFAALTALILSKGTYFLCDTFVNPNPTAEQICDMTILAAAEVERFGVQPKIALLSHSDFGSHSGPEAAKMALATRMVKERAPHLEVEGEMTAAAALSEDVRNMMFPHSDLKGVANLLIMPNIDAANITFHVMKTLEDGIAVGPILLGAKKSAHVLTPSVTVRGIVNAAAYACYRAQAIEKGKKGITRTKRKTK